MRRNAAAHRQGLALLCRKQPLLGAYCAPFGFVIWNEVRLFDFHRLTVETLLQNVKRGIEKHKTGGVTIPMRPGRLSVPEAARNAGLFGAKIAGLSALFFNSLLVSGAFAAAPDGHPVPGQIGFQEAVTPIATGDPSIS